MADPMAVMFVKFDQTSGKIDEVIVDERTKCPQGTTKKVIKEDETVTSEPEEYGILTISDEDHDGVPDYDFQPCVHVRSPFPGVAPESQKAFSDAQALAQKAQALFGEEGYACTAAGAGVSRCENAGHFVLIATDPNAIISKDVVDAMMASGKNTVIAVDMSGDGIPDRADVVIQGDPVYGMAVMYQMPLAVTEGVKKLASMARAAQIKKAVEEPLPK